MNLEYLLQNFGYPAILIGTFLEGETILILAGFAAHRGYLDLKLVMLYAFIGTLAGDQLFFFLGRWRGEAIIQKHPRWQLRLVRTQALIHKHRIALILGFRFIYGLRTVTPFALGMSRVSILLFALLNTTGAMIWTLVISLLGYLFGQTTEALLGNLKRYETMILAGLAGISLAVWLWQHLRHRKKDY